MTGMEGEVGCQVIFFSFDLYLCDVLCSSEVVSFVARLLTPFSLFVVWCGYSRKTVLTSSEMIHNIQRKNFKKRSPSAHLPG